MGTNCRAGLLGRTGLISLAKAAAAFFPGAGAKAAPLGDTERPVGR